MQMTDDKVSGAEQTLYERLGVAEAATEAEIRRAYRKRIKDIHPDRWEGPFRLQMEEMVKNLNATRDELLDPTRRARYDTAWPPRGLTPSGLNVVENQPMGGMWVRPAPGVATREVTRVAVPAPGRRAARPPRVTPAQPRIASPPARGLAPPTVERRLPRPLQTRSTLRRGTLRVRGCERGYERLRGSRSIPGLT